jgi:hypothetical protein
MLLRWNPGPHCTPRFNPRWNMGGLKGQGPMSPSRVCSTALSGQSQALGYRNALHIHLRWPRKGDNEVFGEEKHCTGLRARSSIFIYLFIFMVLKVELMALPLLGRCSTSWAMPAALFALAISSDRISPPSPPQPQDWPGQNPTYVDLVASHHHWLVCWDGIVLTF